MPDVYKNLYLHGSRSRARSAIYIADGCIQKIVIYTAAVQEPNRLYILLSGAYIKLLFTRQPFKSQFKMNSGLLGVHIQCLFTQQ